MNVLTNQEFTYRAVPENYDGTGTLTSVKGNTIVFNQLAKYTSSQGGTACGLTLTNNSDGSFTISGTYNNTGDRNFYGYISLVALVQGHKYLIKSSGSLMGIYVYGSASGERDSTKYIVTATSTGNIDVTIRLIDSKANNGQQVNEKIWVTIFDLTQMGLDSITTVAEFEALFPLSYYAYNTGSLLSFGQNRLVLNQLVQNGNFADTTGWSTYRCNASASSNVISLEITTSGSDYPCVYRNSFPVTEGKKYLISVDCKGNSGNTLAVSTIYKNSSYQVSATGEWQNICFSYTATNEDQLRLGVKGETCSVGQTIQFKNCIIVDLSAMFGTGNEPNAEEFRSMFPEDYYAYDTTGTVQDDNVYLKTTGKNLLNTDYVRVATAWNLYGNTARAVCFAEVFPNTQYTVSAKSTSGVDSVFVCFLQNIGDTTNLSSFSINSSATSPSNAHYIAVQINKTSATKQDYINCGFQLEFGSTATTYAPYTEKVLPLPITKYFPDGQMSAGTVYDELTGTSYIKRIGTVDLGTLTWSYSSGVFISSGQVTRTGADTEMSPLACAMYVTKNYGYNGSYSGENMVIWSHTNGSLRIRNNTYTDVPTFTSAMSGVICQYELLTPLVNYGVVDLGSLTWNRNSVGSGLYRMKSDGIASLIKWSASSSQVMNLVCSKYISESVNATYLKIKGIGVDINGDLYVYDPDIQDADAFKSAMSGVYLLYELETPSTISLDLTYDTWNGGTEQILPSNTSTPSTSPILTDITYRGLIPVSAIASPYGSGTVTGSGQYRYHATATLNATPNDEIYRFIRYEDENGTVLSTSSTYSFIVGD